MSNPETLVIDVRPDSMREETGYFECSTQLVYSEMTPDTFYEAVKELVDHNMDYPILIYCASGQSAMFVQQEISDAGFTNVVAGGSYEDLNTAGCACPSGIF
jgi:rhodanese-related sulfurtransferase